MNFQKAVISALSKYATFTGRAGRSEFWWFWLFGVIAQVVALTLDILLFGSNFLLKLDFAPIRDLVALALLTPFCAVIIRRLHDTDRSHWWMSLLLIPIIGWLVFIYYLAQKGEPVANRYGEPLHVSDSEITESDISTEMECNYEKTESLAGGLTQVKKWKIVFSLAVVAACAAPFITGTWKANPQSHFSVPLTDDERKLRKSEIERTDNCQYWERKWKERKERLNRLSIGSDEHTLAYRSLWLTCRHSLEELKAGHRSGMKFSEWKYLGLNLLAIAATFIGVFILAGAVRLFLNLGSFLLSRYWAWLRN